MHMAGSQMLFVYASQVSIVHFKTLAYFYFSGCRVFNFSLHSQAKDCVVIAVLMPIQSQLKSVRVIYTVKIPENELPPLYVLMERECQC